MAISKFAICNCFLLEEITASISLYWFSNLRLCSSTLIAVWDIILCLNCIQQNFNTVVSFKLIHALQFFSTRRCLLKLVARTQHRCDNTQTNNACTTLEEKQFQIDRHDTSHAEHVKPVMAMYLCLLDLYKSRAVLPGTPHE